MKRSMPTIQNGVVETSTAVSPLGTDCSAQTTRIPRYVVPQMTHTAAHAR